MKTNATRMGSLLLSVVVWCSAAESAHAARPILLDRKQTQKAIALAEAHMVRQRLATRYQGNPQVPVPKISRLTPDPDSPLVGKIGSFKGRLRREGGGLVLTTARIGTRGPGFRDGRTLIATLKQRRLKKLYDFDDMYDDHRMRPRQFERRIKQLRHELRITLPDRLHLPFDPDNDFKANVRVTAVEWDRAALFPVLVIHGELLKSKDLGLN